MISPNVLQSLDQILASRYPAREAPVSAESLLRLCTHLYLRAPHHEVYSNYLEGGYAIFDCWYVQVENKFDTVHTRHYPAFAYPDVCVCGNCISPTGSVLRRDCTVCKGDAREALVGPYEIQRLARYCSVNESYLESIFAKVIYHVLDR